MKLDRNIHSDGRGKYALVHLRKLPDGEVAELLAKAGTEQRVDLPGDALEPVARGAFFVLKYRDKFAAPALRAYATAVMEEANSLGHHSRTYWDNPECEEAQAERRQAESLEEYASQVMAQAEIASTYPDQKLPD